MRDKIVNSLVYLILFLLPWQTRWIFGFEELHGQAWEYGLLSLFAVEILVVFAALLRPRVKARRDADWPLIIGGFFLVAALVSVYGAVEPMLAIIVWLHMFVSYLLFRLLLDRRVAIKYAVGSFVLGLLTPAALGIMQFLIGASPASAWLGLASHEAAESGASVVESLSGRFLRAYGTFQHPNIFGGYLAVGLVGVVLLARWFKTKGEKFGLHIMAAVLAVAFVLTFSRSAWLAFFVASAIGGWIVLWEHRIAARKALPFIIVATAAALLTVLVFFEPVSARFHPEYRLEAISISERTTGLSNWWPTVKEDLLFGVGPGNYTVALAADHPGVPVWAFQPVHNSFLLVLGEVGLAGAFFFVLWAASVDRINYKALPRSTAIAALLMGAIVLVIAFFDHYLFSLWPGLALMAFVFAMTVRLSEVK